MKKKQSKFSIYIIIIISFLAVGIPLGFMGIRMIEMYGHPTMYVEDAYLDATSYDVQDNKPLPLIGEWKVYKGIYYQGGHAELSSKFQNETVWLPTMDLVESKKAQTYQMFLSLDITEFEKNQLYLSIPLANTSAKVYFNGNYVPNTSYDDSWLHIKSQNGLFFIGRYYDKTLEYQEILITVPEEQSLTNLYNREVSVSLYSNYVASEKVSQSLQLLLIGMMLTVILVGFSYMVLVPSYTLLTLMNLFDTAMMLHILFNMSTIPKIALATMNTGNWGCYQFRQLDLGFFMIAGALGPILGKEIFDPDNKAHKIFHKPVTYMYIIISIILATKPELLNSSFLVLIVGVTLFALICVMARVRVTIKAGKMTKYRIFHVGKTFYLGGIILIDLVTLTSSSRNNTLMLILYSIFFLTHLFVKAYEYRLLFANIETMNVQLEATVEERTMELQIVNNELRDISTKDALTGCHNRLYFEKNFDDNVQNLKEGNINQFHLCMFDLDGFKLINDQYGHAEGDEQLIETANIVLNHTEDVAEFARIGGEEFALLFINKEDSEVLCIVEAIRSDLEKLAKDKETRTTGSFGIYKAKVSDVNRSVYATADKCMYYSKQHGKNQITYQFDDNMVSFK